MINEHEFGNGTSILTRMSRCGPGNSPTRFKIGIWSVQRPRSCRMASHLSVVKASISEPPLHPMPRPGRRSLLARFKTIVPADGIRVRAPVRNSYHVLIGSHVPCAPMQAAYRRMMMPFCALDLIPGSFGRPDQKILDVTHGVLVKSFQRARARPLSNRQRACAIQMIVEDHGSGSCELRIC